MKAVTYIEVDVPSFTAQSPEDTQTFRFAMPTDYLPPEIECIPSVDSVSVNPALISLGKDLGQRASITITLTDHRHVMASEPYEQGTFFGKWRGRYGTKLRGREVRLIRGQVGQTIEQMDTRYYVIESVDGPTINGKYTINAKDVLKLADDDRAQAPLLSNGSLAGSINNSTTTALLSPTGIGDFEYPSSGWVCLGGKEVASFTRVSDTLTLTRGVLGSVAQEHSAGDRVQLVLRYTGDDVADIIYDLLTEYAAIPASYIELSEWQAETADFLNVIYARTITEPTSVNKLVSELIEQAALAVWWDDRARKVRLQVLREISTETDTFDAERIIDGSFSVKEQPNKRISEIWTYYGERDPTDRGANEDNFRAAIATTDGDSATEYGSPEIVKVQGKWLETETAATRLNSIQLSRFRDPPRSFAFDVFRDVDVALAAGYQVSWWGNQTAEGVEVPARIQVTKVSLFPDRIHVEAEEMLAFGVVVLVNVVFLTTTGSVLSFVVPDTWNDADNSIEVIGGGGGGDEGASTGGRGGGGGAYSRIENVNLTPAASVSYRVGAGGAGDPGGSVGQNGGDTWFGAATFAASLVGARGGTGGNTSGPATGGQAADGIGTVRTSGGNGRIGGNNADNATGGGGGGGAGGPHGDGADGGTGGTNARCGGGGGGADGGFTGGNSSGHSTVGDGGNNRFNFGGGNATLPAGREGGGGRGGERGGSGGGPGGAGEQIWTQTVAPIISAGPGGGGGGAADNAGSGGDGGLYGGGGGGSNTGPGGDGAQGIIVIRWREAE